MYVVEIHEDVTHRQVDKIFLFTLFRWKTTQAFDFDDLENPEKVSFLSNILQSRCYTGAEKYLQKPRIVRVQRK